MSAILKFITVMEKILIIICIMCFIPTSIFIYMPKNHVFSDTQITGYEDAYRKAPSNCSSIKSELTFNIQAKQSLYYYKAFEDSSRLLWYYSLPILATLVGLALVNEVSNKYNLRKYILMGAFTINIALITLIIKTALYFSDMINFQALIYAFAQCSAGGGNKAIQAMASFDFGISYGYLYFMGFVALLIFLSMIGLLLAKLLELKYYSSREVPQEVGIELSDIQSSLRSRMINTSNSTIPPHKKVRIQTQDSNI